MKPRKAYLSTVLVVLGVGGLFGCGGGAEAPHPAKTILPNGEAGQRLPEPGGNTCVTKLPPKGGECVRQYEAEHTLGEFENRATVTSNPQGVDVSQWQGYPEWGVAKRSGLKFVYNQASYGVNREPAFATNTIRERADHIAHGAYVYVYPGCSNPATVASVLVGAIKEAGGFDSLPPAIDQENDGCYSFSTAISAWDCQLANDIRHDDGWSEVLLYTSPGLWPGGTNCGDYLWLADWGGFRLPSSWSSAIAQQYCGNGCTFPGVSGFVDRDVSLGLLAIGRQPVKPKPTPTTLKRELYADYKVRNEVESLQVKHHCLTKPTPANYRRACQVWKPQLKRVEEQIKALHARHVY